MQSKTFFRNCILGASCSLFISSCCCFGARGINFDMKKGIVNEGTNNFSDVAAVISYQGSDKTANDTPHVYLPWEE